MVNTNDWKASSARSYNSHPLFKKAQRGSSVRRNRNGKYRIRIALVAFISGWFMSGIYYGAIPKMVHAQEVITEPVAVTPMEISCVFEFPALPIDMLEGK